MYTVDYNSGKSEAAQILDQALQDWNDIFIFNIAPILSDGGVCSRKKMLKIAIEQLKLEMEDEA